MHDWRNEPESFWLRLLGGVLFGLALLALYAGLVAIGEVIAR